MGHSSYLYELANILKLKKKIQLCMDVIYVFNQFYVTQIYV